MTADRYVVVIAIDDCAEAELAFARGLPIAARQPGAQVQAVPGGPSACRPGPLPRRCLGSR